MNKQLSLLTVVALVVGLSFYVWKTRQALPQNELAKSTLMDTVAHSFETDPHDTDSIEEVGLYQAESKEDSVPLQAARSFKLPSVVDPDKILTEAIFKGKVTILNVWASWCGPCRQETDMLVNLAKNSGLHWVGLNINDDLDEAQRMLQIYGNPYHETIYDRNGGLSRAFGVRVTPEVFILDKAGNIQYRHMGIIDEYTWKEEILPVIKELQ